MRLAGKVAIVTGAGRGIGRGIALALSREGARIVVNYFGSAQMAHDLVAQIRESGQDAFAIQADVSKSVEVTHMVNETVKRFGDLDILVNNTGITILKPFLEDTEEIWDKTIDINLKGMFLCSLAAAKVMAGKRRGKIVNISSVNGYATIPGLTHYAASKGGIQMLTKAMALDLAPYQINVNCIGPGTIEVEKYFNDPNYSAEKWGQGIPWGRVGVPADIGKAVVFLASDDADYITGQVFYVDGGITAYTGWRGQTLSEDAV